MEIKRWLKRILPKDLVIEADMEGDERSPITQYFRNLPDSLTFKDLYWQGRSDDIETIEGWEEIMSQLEEKHTRGLRKLFSAALRTSTIQRGLNQPGWTLGEFRQMQAGDFPEEPEREGSLSRKEFKLLHRLLATPHTTEDYEL